MHWELLLMSSEVILCLPSLLTLLGTLDAGYGLPCWEEEEGAVGCQTRPEQEGCQSLSTTKCQAPWARGHYSISQMRCQRLSMMKQLAQGPHGEQQGWDLD